LGDIGTEDDIHINNNNQLALISNLEDKITSLVSEVNLQNMALKVDFGGKVIAHGILSGTEILQRGIQIGGKKIKQNLKPGEKPIEIPDSIKATLAIAKEITPHFVKLSDTLVSGVSTVAKGMAGSTSSVVLSKFSKKTGLKIDSDPRFAAAKNLGKAGVVAFVTIWNSLEDAGMALLDSTGSVAADVISHKFGTDAGNAARDGFHVAHNVLKTGQSLNSLGPKSLAKQVAKQSTKTMAISLFGTKTEVEYSKITDIEDIQDDVKFIQELPSVTLSEDIPYSNINEVDERSDLRSDSKKKESNNKGYTVESDDDI